MEHRLGADSPRISELAQSLGCFSSIDLRDLCGITEKTEEDWRKRGNGPAYILAGNNYLYPKEALADFLRTKLRERRTVGGKGLL